MTLINNCRSKLPALAVILTLSCVGLLGRPVSANTVVGASICNQSDTATLVITQPISGHTTSQMPVTVSGSLKLLSQIRVYVDSVYTETIPIAADETNFSYVQYLGVGTHEVRLEGVDACQQTSPVAQITIVYNPETTVVGQPVSPQDPQAPAEEYAPIEDQPTFFERVTTNGVISSVSNAAYGVLEALDIVNSSEATQTTKMVGRFTLVTAGSTLVLLAPCVIQAVTTAIAKIVPHQDALALGRPRLFGPAWVRALGVVLLAIGVM